MKAMSELSSLLGHLDDARQLSEVAHDYLPRFLDFATSVNKDRLTLSYHNESSWGTMYNMWPDVLLGLDFLPKEVYAMQEKWYPTVMSQAFIHPIG